MNSAPDKAHSKERDFLESFMDGGWMNAVVVVAVAAAATAIGTASGTVAAMMGCSSNTLESRKSIFFNNV